MILKSNKKYLGKRFASEVSRNKFVSNICCLSSDNSTSCDDEITWIRTSAKTATPAKAKKGSSTPQKAGTSSSSSPQIQVPGKPPRPSIGSLDRRRLNMNRSERDSKSRSTHSLKEGSKDMKNKDDSSRWISMMNLKVWCSIIFVF